MACHRDRLRLILYGKQTHLPEEIFEGKRVCSSLPRRSIGRIPNAARRYRADLSGACWTLPPASLDFKAAICCSVTSIRKKRG